MTKVVYMKLQMMLSKTVVKSTFTQELMQSFQLRMKLHSDSEINISSLINQDGALAWRRTSGYYRQSEVENMFFRYKKLIGDELKARGENSRRVESIIACNILNQFRLLGSPQSTLVA